MSSPCTTSQAVKEYLGGLVERRNPPAAVPSWSRTGVVLEPTLFLEQPETVAVAGGEKNGRGGIVLLWKEGKGAGAKSGVGGILI